MRASFLGATALALSITVLTGCSRSGPVGGPGAAKKDTGGSGKSNTEDSTSTFTPAAKDTSVTQGKSTTENVTLSRGKNFTQVVTIALKAPKGLTLNPDKLEFKGDDTKQIVNVTAADDATVGPHVVEMTATPETGAASSVRWSVDVKAK